MRSNPLCVLCGFNGMFDVSSPEIVLCIFTSRGRHGSWLTVSVRRILLFLPFFAIKGFFQGPLFPGNTPRSHHRKGKKENDEAFRCPSCGAVHGLPAGASRSCEAAHLISRASKQRLHVVIHPFVRLQSLTRVNVNVSGLC